MSVLPWWAGALALAAVPMVSWVLLGRMLAVSGRFTAVIDHVRERLHPTAHGPELGPAELLAALTAATEAEFGTTRDAHDPALDDEAPPTYLPSTPRADASHHLLFLLGVVGGAALLAAFAGRLSPGLHLAGTGFARAFGRGIGGQLAVLVSGGFLVGFGTRMSGGCSSSHGLCGVSRFQPGSIASTASFFTMAAVVSLLLERLR